MKYICFPLLVFGIIMSSCKNNEDKKSQKDPRLIIPFNQQMYTSSTQTPKPVEHNLFHEKNPVTSPSVVSGVNPAHGQPGHRCDIPVGAPLNSSAKGQTTTQTVSPQQIQVSQPVVSKTITPKGMNPPHGQPGHRCDIAVGAPLNSKPVATKTTTTQTPQVTTTSGEVSKQINVQPQVPALLSQDSTNKTKTAEGMNPPHGQEGHRCDIAVGAPLPKS